MLRAEPKSIFSWDFTLYEDEQPVAFLDSSEWRERGEFTIDGRTCKLSKQGMMPTTFYLTVDGTEIARAEKRGVFSTRFEVQAGHQTLLLKQIRGRRFELQYQDEAIGTIEPTGWFTRRAEIELPESFPLELRIYLFWLVVIAWRRAAAAASG